MYFKFDLIQFECYQVIETHLLMTVLIEYLEQFISFIILVIGLFTACFLLYFLIGTTSS